MRLSILALTAAACTPIFGKELYPNIADTSHASDELVKFFRGFSVTKSLHILSEWLSYWNPIDATYYDSTLGETIAANRSQLDTNLNFICEQWNKTAPNGRSYPLRILGDTVGGAVIYFVDNPGLFHREVRALASFDFVNGTVRRELDNWDGRDQPAKKNNPVTTPYPIDLGLAGVEEKAAPEMRKVAHQLNTAFSTSNVTAAAALFNYNAVFEDLTLRLTVNGVISIRAYLERALSKLPYGPGTTLTHVLGSAQGGGYEWRPAGDTVKYGIIALELGQDGSITRFTSVWDGSVVSKATIQSLAIEAPSP